MNKIENFTEAREMANYILSIIRRNAMIYFSWGVTNLQVLPKMTYENGDSSNMGLRFKTNGIRHKGWVRIEYDAGTDYFNVILERKGKVKCIDEREKYRVDDVDFESLADVIDNLVERTDNYEEDVTKEFKRLSKLETKKTC